MVYYGQNNTGPLHEGRILGATKIGSYWAISADAEKPNDKRIKSGKYIKKGDINGQKCFH